MTSVVLIRHAEPLVTGATPPAEWPLTEKGRKDATALGTRLARRAAVTVVWTSPERRASETAALAFPSTVPSVRDQLGEVEKPWYATANEHTNAVAEYLRGEELEGWERRADVISRTARLTSGFASQEKLALVTHGLLLTTWLDHEVGLDDPFSFWSNLQMPDAWEVRLDQNTVQRFL